MVFELTETERNEVPQAARDDVPRAVGLRPTTAGRSPATAWQLDLTGVNAYLVDDCGTVTLVDTGTPWGVSTLLDEIEATGHALSDIDRVLLTHYDIDHVGGLGRLGLDVPVYAGMPDGGFLTGIHRPPLAAKGLLHRVLGPFFRDRSLTIEAVEDGDVIGSFTAYHTPGHTPGHMAYLSESLSIGFVGDLIIERNGEMKPSPWFLSYDSEQVTDSILELADRQPPIEVVCFGHGVPFLKNGSVRVAEFAQSMA